VRQLFLICFEILGYCVCTQVLQPWNDSKLWQRVSGNVLKVGMTRAAAIGRSDPVRGINRAGADQSSVFYGSVAFIT
jgi:hypothetical protein